MGNSLVYAAVNTKIRAMEGDFLTREDYRNMLQKHSVPELARYLKDNTHYAEFLKDVDEDNISRRDLEEIFRRRMINDLDRLIYYFKGGYRDFVRSLYLKYEIADIKHLARLIFNGSKPQDFSQSLTFIGKYSRLHPEKLFAAASIRDLITSMEGSEFYPFVKPLLDGRRENLFRFEMALDMGYFSMINQRREKISGTDYRIVQFWEGTVADLYNIQWIYRGKKFYRLLPEELLNYTLDFGEELSFTKRKALCYAANLEEFYELVQSTGYQFLFKKNQTQDIYMERRINRYIYHLLKALNRKYPMTIIQTICYVWFLDYEIKDIFAICESIRYRITPEEARRFLIRAF